MQCTRHLLLIIETDDKGNLHRCIDGAHTVHSNTKRHSRLLSAINRGAIINAPNKLEIATNSSTETKVVFYGENFLKHAWFCCFKLA